jgi:cytoskeletal protein CcmA (bactofilin family)
MFSKSNRRESSSSMPSIVSADATVHGDIASSGDIQIEGKVTGDVVCVRLTLGQDGEVNGRVECETAKLHGAISGEVHAATVVVSASARVSGDVHHETISVETGAQIEGRLVRRQNKAMPLNLVTDQTMEAVKS